MTKRPDTTPTRRNFLRNALGASVGLLAASCTPSKPPQEDAKPQPPAPPAPEPAPPAPAVDPDALPDGLNQDFFHLHTRQPLTLEARRGALGLGVITPMSRFFVRNNLPMPEASIVDHPDHWELQIEGVARPGKLSVADLKQLGGMESVTTVLQCSGNGRQFYQHRPSGSQWGTGAAGCAIWTGVPLRLVAQAMGGPLPEALYVTSTGGDPLPEGVNPLDVMVERSITIEKGLQDCLLAWEMNGQPIPLSHGGPLRLIVPGYYGCNQIKYIKKLAFTVEQTQAKIQRSGYRMRDIGQKGNPTQPSMWQMNLKSWILGPGAEDAPVRKGKIQLYGVAFSDGSAPISGVEVSVDGGQTWGQARLVGPDMGPYAWRNFVYEAELATGTHQVASRATDAKGQVQPEARHENERGYGNNSWRDMMMALRVVDELPKPTPGAVGAPPRKGAAGEKPAAGQAQLSEAGQKGRAVFTKDAQPSCTACHTLADAGSSGVVGPNLNDLAPNAERVTQAVTNGVGAMPSYKDILSPEQIRDLATYVSEAVKK